MRKPDRAQIAIWAVLVVATVAISLQAFDAYQLGTHFDDARYIILARSLISSNQYGGIHLAGQTGIPWYPFGYPLLLTPFVLQFPENLEAAKLLSLLATVANATLLFWGWPWYSRRSHWWAVAVVALYVFAPLSIDLSRRVMSEPFFITVCLAALLLTERAAQGKKTRGWSCLMGVTLTFVLFVRTIGVVLIACAFVYLLFARRKAIWKELALTVTTAVVLVGFIVALTPVELGSLLPIFYLKSFEKHSTPLLEEAPQPETGSEDPTALSHEVDQPVESRAQIDLGLFMRRFVNAGLKYHLGQDVRRAILPIGGGAREQAFAEQLGVPFLPMLVGFAVFGLVAVGYSRWLIQEGLSAFNLFAVVYFGALFLWVWDDPRLLYPILPQLQYAFLLGIETILAWTLFRGQRGLLPKLSKVMMVSIFLVLALVSAYRSLRIDDSRLHAGDIQLRSSWLKANTPPSAIVMTEAPEVDHIYHGRRTVRYPGALASASELADFLAEHGVDFILVAPGIRWQLSYVPTYSEKTVNMLPLITSLVSEDRITLVYSSEQDRIKVFQVLPRE